MTAKDAAALHPTDLVTLIEKVVGEAAAARGERQRSSLGTFWPIILCLLTVTGLSFVTYGRAADAKDAIENPATGLRATMNAIDKKVDVGFTDLRRTLEERLPAKPPR